MENVPISLSSDQLDAPLVDSTSEQLKDFDPTAVNKKVLLSHMLHAMGVKETHDDVVVERDSEDDEQGSDKDLHPVIFCARSRPCETCRRNRSVSASPRSAHRQCWHSHWLGLAAIALAAAARSRRQQGAARLCQAG